MRELTESEIIVTARTCFRDWVDAAPADFAANAIRKAMALAAVSDHKGHWFISPQKVIAECLSQTSNPTIWHMKIHSDGYCHGNIEHWKALSSSDLRIPPKLRGMKAKECREPKDNERWYTLGGDLTAGGAHNDPEVGQRRWIYDEPAAVERKDHWYKRGDTIIKILCAESSDEWCISFESGPNSGSMGNITESNLADGYDRIPPFEPHMKAKECRPPVQGKDRWYEYCTTGRPFILGNEEYPPYNHPEVGDRRWIYDEHAAVETPWVNGPVTVDYLAHLPPGASHLVRDADGRAICSRCREDEAEIIAAVVNWAPKAAAWMKADAAEDYVIGDHLTDRGDLLFEFFDTFDLPKPADKTNDD